MAPDILVVFEILKLLKIGKKILTTNIINLPTFYFRLFFIFFYFFLLDLYTSIRGSKMALHEKWGCLLRYEIFYCFTGVWVGAKKKTAKGN